MKRMEQIESTVPFVISIGKVLDFVVNAQRFARSQHGHLKEVRVRGPTVLRNELLELGVSARGKDDFGRFLRCLLEGG